MPDTLADRLQKRGEALLAEAEEFCERARADDYASPHIEAADWYTAACACLAEAREQRKAEQLAALPAIIRATVGEVLREQLDALRAELEAEDAEPTGLSAVVGKWPGNETDEEINEALAALRGPEEATP